MVHAQHKPGLYASGGHMRLTFNMVFAMVFYSYSEFVRYLHVIDALWLATNVEAQDKAFCISLYHVLKHHLA